MSQILHMYRCFIKLFNAQYADFILITGISENISACC